MKTARELVHEATRAADEQGAGNLFHCAFKTDVDCCLPCGLLRSAIEADRREVRAAALREAAAELVSQPCCGARLIRNLFLRAERGE